MKELAPFLRLLRPQREWIVWAIVCGSLTLLSGVGLLAVSGWFISATAVAGLTIAAAQTFNIFTPSASIRGFAVLRTAGRYVERLLAHEATLRLLASLRVWFYRKIEPQAPASLYRHRSGDLLNRIVTDIDTLDALFIRVLSPTVVALVVALFSAALLCWLSPALALVFLLFFFAAGVVAPLVTLRLGRPVGSRMQQQMALLRTGLVEDLRGMADLIIYGALQRHQRQRLDESDRLLRLQEQMARISGLGIALTTLCSGLAALTALYLAIPMVQQGAFDGALLALISFGILAAFEAVLPLPAAYQMLGKIRAAARRLLEVSEAPALVTFPAEPAPPPQDHSIRYARVSFTYPDTTTEKALEQIDLLVPDRSKTAIVGPSGSGKTSLAHLLTRFWDPHQGQISIGGVALRAFTEEQLRRMITLVSQKSHIFNSSLRDNLLIADPQATDDQLWHALEHAQLADFVSRLPEGLDTWSGEGGARLSGGEARRLVLARALLKNSPIWILDEPTEGLDLKTRHLFMEILFASLAGKSALLITHNSDVLEQVDQVCFLVNGRLQRCGRHHELLADCADYRHFLTSRAGGIKSVPG